MSAALELPLHPDFRENGDHRLTVLSKIPAPPFTFYDQMTRTGFKAVSEGPSGHIDKSTRQELENTLKVKALDNEQTVDRTIVIFASREAALKNAAAVTALGASGAVYVGDDTRLWNPLPEKNLIDVDWSKA
jgi:hypothetical protein